MIVDNVGSLKLKHDGIVKIKDLFNFNKMLNIFSMIHNGGFI